MIRIQFEKIPVVLELILVGYLIRFIQGMSTLMRWNLSGQIRTWQNYKCTANMKRMMQIFTNDSKMKLLRDKLERIEDMRDLEKRKKNCMRKLGEGNYKKAYEKASLTEADTDFTCENVRKTGVMADGFIYIASDFDDCMEGLEDYV